MKKTNIISWMVSGWIEEALLGDLGGGTAALTIGCSDDFFAVRLGFANVTSAPWTITKVIGSPSAAFNDYINPVQPANWKPFTFAMGGEDSRDVVTRPSAPLTITVAPTSLDGATGEEHEPCWTWTDWTPIASDEPDPETGLRVLMIRGLIPPKQKVCFAHGLMRNLSRDSALTSGFNFLVGGLKFNHDRVSEPDNSFNESDEIWLDNALVGGSIFPIVQFLTKNAGVVGMTMGDSHQQGTSTTEQFSGFLYRAVTGYGKPTIGKMPVGMVNLAMGGLASTQFFPRFASLVRMVRPSFIVLPGWTYNDISDGVHANDDAINKFLARLMMAIELCRSEGCLPICLTPFPRDSQSMTPTQMAPWLRLRSIILEWAGSQVLVLDAYEALGTWEGGKPTGIYREGVTTDGCHPNDSGHQLLAEKLREMIEGFDQPLPPLRLAPQEPQRGGKPLVTKIAEKFNHFRKSVRE